jgi:4-amino-4-deoxy-L-arabinose transferase-like glycosyltransferase
MAPADIISRPVPAWRAEKAAALVAAVACVIYWAATLVLARRKLMWNDELYTYYVAMLPSMHDVWSALMAKGEQTPPFFYLVTRAALRLFGVNNVSIRLPEMLAFCGMSACLFVAVRRRTTPLAGLCAALFPLVTAAYAYAFEARSYALVLGFAAAAYLSWQSLAFGKHRPLWLLCLIFSLAAAASSHYYGALVVLPLAAGEIVRSTIRRRIDVAVWIAFPLSLVPLIWHLPLIRAGRAYSGAFWSPPQWVNIPDFYVDLLTPAIVPIVAILVACGVAAAFMNRGRDEGVEARVALPFDDIAAGVGFVVIPIVAVIAAKLLTGAFVNRYALPAVIGFSILAGFGVASAFRRSAAMRLLVAVSLCGWFFLSGARELIQPTGVTLPVSAASMARPSKWLDAVPQDKRGLPLVIADPHSFVTLSHYSAPDVKTRLVYLADPDRALAHLGANSVERGMLDLVKPWFGMNVVLFEPFVAGHDEFFVYGDFVRLSFLNWIVPELHAQGMRTELLDRAGDDMLLYVSRDASRGFSAEAQ